MNLEHIRIGKHTVRVAGHVTSVSLEDPYWDALGEIAEFRNQSINALITEIDAVRSGNLSSALRVFVLRWYRGQLNARAAA
ncbi:MAG: ribbon-helix-helix domain-containing protein [Magnetospiraceae bacterium]